MEGALFTPFPGVSGWSDLCSPPSDSSLPPHPWVWLVAGVGEVSENAQEGYAGMKGQGQILLQTQPMGVKGSHSTAVGRWRIHA